MVQRSSRVYSAGLQFHDNRDEIAHLAAERDHYACHLELSQILRTVCQESNYRMNDVFVRLISASQGGFVQFLEKAVAILESSEYKIEQETAKAVLVKALQKAADGGVHLRKIENGKAQKVFMALKQGGVPRLRNGKVQAIGFYGLWRYGYSWI